MPNNMPLVDWRRLDDYLAMDHLERPFARFDPAIVDHPPEADPRVAERLAALSNTAINSSPAELKAFLIDLAWKSSELEGSTYTLMDTKALLEYGVEAQGKPAVDAQIVLNHRRAIDWLLTLDGPVEPDHTLEINRRILHGLEAQGREGVLREYGDIAVAHSSYQPTMDGPLLKRCFNSLHRCVQGIASAHEQAFYLFSRLPYLQPFFDGNKRTARVLCNAPLLGAGFCPISLIDIDRGRYLRALLFFYESGDDAYLRDVFLTGYMSSVLRYRRWTPEMRIHITSHKWDLIAAMRRFVDTGDNDLPAEIA